MAEFSVSGCIEGDLFCDGIVPMSDCVGDEFRAEIFAKIRNTKKPSQNNCFSLCYGGVFRKGTKMRKVLKVAKIELLRPRAGNADIRNGV